MPRIYDRSTRDIFLWHVATLVTDAQEGPLALYNGWLPSVIGVVPYVGLNFAVYETLKAGLQKQYGNMGVRVAWHGRVKLHRKT